MLTPLNALILGIVEGITEFLPISSTGHLILAAKALAVPSSDFLKSFEIIIQLGATTAVVALYAPRLIANRKRLLTILAAFAPVAAIGFLAYPLVKSFLLGSVNTVVWALFIGGVALIAFEFFHAKRKKPELVYLTYRHAMLIGLFQSVALIPGVSRSAATIVGALLLGYKREAAVEFSFLLAIPTMLAASGYDLYKTGAAFSADQASLLAIGFGAAFITALLAVRWLLRFIKGHTFTAFGVYRIALAAVFFLFVSL